MPRKKQKSKPKNKTPGVVLESKQLDTLIDYMTGTCRTLDEGLEHCGITDGKGPLTETDLSLETLNKIDDQIFCCTQCGWWASVEEESEVASCNSDLVCRECGGDEDEEREDDDE